MPSRTNIQLQLWADKEIERFIRMDSAATRCPSCQSLNVNLTDKYYAVCEDCKFCCSKSNLKYRGVNEMPLNAPVKETIVVPVGEHKGVIKEIKTKEVVYGDERFTYLQIYVTVDGVKKADGETLVIHLDCPFEISENNTLGKLLMKFGCTEDQIRDSVRLNKDIDVEQYIKVGTKVVYTTDNEKGKKGGLFAKILVMRKA